MSGDAEARLKAQKVVLDLAAKVEQVLRDKFPHCLRDPVFFWEFCVTEQAAVHARFKAAEKEMDELLSNGAGEQAKPFCQVWGKLYLELARAFSGKILGGGAA